MVKSLKVFVTLTFAALVAFTIDGLAQAKDWMEKPAEERAQVLTDWMKSELQLTEDQEAPVYDINLKYAKKGDEIKQSSGRKIDKFKKVKAYGQEKDEELKSVFTEDQYALYLDKKKEIKENVKESSGK
jgi:hypothetical protein